MFSVFEKGEVVLGWRRGRSIVVSARLEKGLRQISYISYYSSNCRPSSLRLVDTICVNKFGREEDKVRLILYC